MTAAIGGIKIGGQSICYSKFIAVSDPTTTPLLHRISGSGNGGYESVEQLSWQRAELQRNQSLEAGFSDSVNISKGRHLFVAGVDFPAAVLV